MVEWVLSSGCTYHPEECDGKLPFLVVKLHRVPSNPQKLLFTGETNYVSTDLCLK